MGLTHDFGGLCDHPRHDGQRADVTAQGSSAVRTSLEAGTPAKGRALEG